MFVVLVFVWVVGTTVYDWQVLRVPTLLGNLFNRAIRFWAWCGDPLFARLWLVAIRDILIEVTRIGTVSYTWWSTFHPGCHLSFTFCSLLVTKQKSDHTCSRILNVLNISGKNLLELWGQQGVWIRGCILIKEEILRVTVALIIITSHHVLALNLSAPPRPIHSTLPLNLLRLVVCLRVSLLEGEVIVYLLGLKHGCVHWVS